MLLAAGCSSKPAPAQPKDPEPKPDVVADANACATEIALECGDGMVDGCTNNTTTHHACVSSEAKAGPPCEQEIALQCAEGQVDACLATPAKAAAHVCIMK
ncbi:MAG: hypothetical protein WKG01_22185 [Kofleriaceae bacterium]